MKKIIFIFSQACFFSFSSLATDIDDGWDEINLAILNQLLDWNEELSLDSEQKENDKNLANVQFQPVRGILKTPAKAHSRKKLGVRFNDYKLPAFLRDFDSVATEANQKFYASEKYALIQTLFAKNKNILSTINSSEYQEIKDAIKISFPEGNVKRASINLLKQYSRRNTPLF